MPKIVRPLNQKEHHIQMCLERGLRPCEVNGALCIFHYWGSDDKVYLQLNALMREEDKVRVIEDFKAFSYAPACCKIILSSAQFALVEFPDGAVLKVESDQVRFLDRGCEV